MTTISTKSYLMRIELYKLTKDEPGFDLGTLLDEIAAKRLKTRNRQRDTDFVRLEARQQKDNLWFCDFVRLRMHHGPGRAGTDTAAEGFDLKKDEGFGEETGFLWDSANDWCVAQYNHYGVRPGTIAEYLGLFRHDHPVQLDLLPKLDDKIHAKINAKKVVTKLVLSVAPKELSDNDYDLGSGLGQATKDLKQSDAERIEIIISTRKKGGLDLSLPGLTDWIKKVGGGSEDSPVHAARATAHEEFKAGSSEVLDLLHARITKEEALKPGADKRYSRQDRWDALHRAHTTWKHLMK